MADNVNEQKELIELLDAILQNAKFDAGTLGSYTPSQLRQLYSSGNEMILTSVHSSEPLVYERLLLTLSQRVRTVLGDFIIPGEDAIPNKLTPLMGGVTKLTMPEFVAALIRASAVLGTPRATQMLFEWVEDKPIRYWKHIVLDGVSVDQPIELNASVRVMNLPNSSSQIPRHVPFGVRGFQYSEMAYAGRAKLSLEFETTFLSKLPFGQNVHVEHKHTSLGIENFSYDEFRKSLALACNHYVSWVTAWSECEDWEMFRTMIAGAMSGDSIGHNKMNMSREHLAKACELFALMQSKGTAMKRLRIAISRWMRSKRDGASLADRFIDLRIALEALYLPGMKGELGFRLATHGAWDLGADFEQRRQYFEILRRVYALASKVVHATTVDHGRDNLKLLNTAQDLCREGILKRLRENEEPNWNDLILGKESVP